MALNHGICYYFNTALYQLFIQHIFMSSWCRQFLGWWPHNVKVDGKKLQLHSLKLLNNEACLHLPKVDIIKVYDTSNVTEALSLQNTI